MIQTGTVLERLGIEELDFDSACNEATTMVTHLTSKKWKHGALMNTFLKKKYSFSMRLYSWLEKMFSYIYCLCATVQNREVLTNMNITEQAHFTNFR